MGKCVTAIPQPTDGILEGFDFSVNGLLLVFARICLAWAHRVEFTLEVIQSAYYFPVTCTVTVITFQIRYVDSSQQMGTDDALVPKTTWSSFFSQFYLTDRRPVNGSYDYRALEENAK